MQKQIPILFSAAMVQAILAFLKTMTRRLKGLENINNNPSDWQFEKFEENAKGGLNAVFKHREGLLHESIPSPYGKPGDVLWVRETFRKYCHVDTNGYTHFDKEIIEFAADNPPAIYLVDGDGAHVYNKDGTEKFVPWRPNIFMPKETARIWLEVIDIRVERLQEISEEDAKAEGVKPAHCESNEGCPSSLCKEKCNAIGDWWNYLAPDGEDFPAYSAMESFQSLWQSINGVESWNSNPWCWCITFKVLSTTGKPELLTEKITA